MSRQFYRLWQLLVERSTGVELALLAALCEHNSTDGRKNRRLPLVHAIVAASTELSLVVLRYQHDKYCTNKCCIHCTGTVLNVC
eukprot:SAG11_NODE_555_length_8566_cov_15.547774_7_plen_84_part_00